MFLSGIKNKQLPTQKTTFACFLFQQISPQPASDFACECWWRRGAISQKATTTEDLNGNNVSVWRPREGKVLCSRFQGKTKLYGGFLKWWYPTTMGFPAKIDHFGGTIIFGNTHINLLEMEVFCFFLSFYSSSQKYKTNMYVLLVNRS